MQLEATDSDSGDLGNVAYMISSGNDDGVFAIGLTSGEINVTMNVDREMRDTFTFTVVAQDGGLHKLYLDICRDINKEHMN